MFEARTDPSQAVHPDHTPRRGIVSRDGLARAVMSPATIGAVWICVGLHLFITLSSQLPQRQRSFDFAVYYVEALMLRQGTNPYVTSGHPLATRLGLDIGENEKAVDMPTLLWAFEPFTLLKPTTAYWMWFALNAGLLSASLLMLLGTGSGYGARGAWMVAGLVLLYPPITVHFFYAQTQLIVLFLFAAAIRSMGAKHDAPAGIALALSALLRGYPLIVFGYLVVRRRWRTLVFATAALGVGGILTLIAAGVGSCLSFLKVPAMANSAFFLLRPELAINAVVARMALTIGGTASLGGPVRVAIVAFVELGLLAATIYATYVAAPTPDHELRGFSLWVITCVVLSPIVWVHYLVLFVILFAQLGVAAERSSVSLRALEMACGSFLLINAAIMVQSGIWANRTASAGAFSVLGFSSIIAAYLSAYWFATDGIFLPFRQNGTQA